jgi:exopolyphosphatase / guanosine-5'-triphosphate,3'-diphosphate pyrophosphatase
MRVGVVDIGTNSTRLLVAEVEGDALTEVERRTTVTRLGEGVEATGRLSDAAIARVSEALAGYRAALDELGAERVVAVATSGSQGTRRPGSRSSERPRGATRARRRS